MKNIKTKIGLFVVAAGATMGAGPASAGWAVSVLDLNNLFVNKALLVSNGIQNGQLELIRQELKDGGEGTIKNYTINIDKSMTHVDESVTNIDESIHFNTEINNDFTWIINQDGDEIIPIPFADTFKEIMDDQDVGNYTGHYKNASSYKDDPFGRYGDEAAFEGSRARKAANDALVDAVVKNQEALDVDVNSLRQIFVHAKDARGHGKQLQVSNALAATEVAQLMKLRGMMLATEAVRAAEAQAAADRDARAIAVGKKLREGLGDIFDRTKAVPAAY